MSEHHFNNTCVPSTDPTEINISRDNTDSVVYSIIQKFKRRADFGKKKYNTDLDRNDLSLKDWYNHLHEELFDSILYLEKIMQEIDKITPHENARSSSSSSS
jgi:hypothetical protein